jgi:hypothetical protein
MEKTPDFALAVDQTWLHALVDSEARNASFVI